MFLIGRRLTLFIGDMYNRYTCPLQPCTHLTLKLLTQGHPRSAEVTHIVNFKNAYISLIIMSTPLDQNYRETMRGIRSFMGWTRIPDMDSAAATSDDNPFAGPKTQPTGKVSVKMPTDEWLCRKMGKLNLTLVEVYPSHSSEVGGLLKDQFVRPASSRSKWYGSVPDQQKSDTGSGKTVSSWSTDASKVNSTYSRIARAAGIASTPPASRQISQDNLRRWEKSAREASTICNQAASFNRCLYKVLENMQSQLKLIKSDLGKGKSSSRMSGAADELQFLMTFNSSITQAMAKTLELCLCYCC